MNRKPLALTIRTACLALAILSATGGAAAAPLMPPASRAAVIETAPVEITPVQLLGAALISDTVTTTLIQESNYLYWVQFPEFDVPPFNADGYSPGERFSVTQGYEQPRAPHGLVVVWLRLFETPAAASAAFAAVSPSSLDSKGTAIVGPPIADEQRYFTVRDPEGHEKTPDGTVVRFRVGPIIGTVLRWRASGPSGDVFEPAPVLAQLAMPVVNNLHDLLAGKDVISPKSTETCIGACDNSLLPPSLAGVMPPAVAGVGPELGSAGVPAQAWALIDTANDPVVVNQYFAGGMRLGFRQLALAADADQVVELTLFPFKDASSAQAFAARFRKHWARLTDGKLDAGNTGEGAVYGFEGDVYELQFTVGAYLADVSCNAPYTDSSPACEPAVRQVAEAWYPVLAAQATS